MLKLNLLLRHFKALIVDALIYYFLRMLGRPAAF